MYRKLYLVILCLFVWQANADSNFGVRKFPPNTVYATIKSVNLPQLKIQEIPSNWGSSLLGLIFLSSAIVDISPATVMRDTANNNHVQGYVEEMLNQPVAIQFDFQHRVWVIWQLNTLEIQWVLNNKLNIWSKNPQLLFN